MHLRHFLQRTRIGLQLFFAIMLLAPTVTRATPYVSPEILQQQLEVRLSEQPPGPSTITRGWADHLDELDEYTYTLEMMDILDWLTIMQVSDAGPNFGGMREGEQDWDIIQTDNTQEALRDWSHYGRVSGDLDRYAGNIADAWIYTLNWPAYEEEGGGDPNYYRVHNSGWGLVATMEYTLAYGDTTYLAYGDSCAAYIDTYRLDIGLGGINPLAAGFGAGSLYLYGVWRDNAEWIAAAQEIALEVQNWIEENPNRLNTYENWAMSAGTAMWGVVTALYLDDPEAGQEWIPQYTGYMDVYSGPGTWNNSWTIWYGHAWSAVHRVLGDDQSLENTRETVDFLLDQDEVDMDGGVPATENQWYNDQSWTSAYLVWYGIENILEFTAPSYDAVPLALVSPEPAIPLRNGEPVSFQVVVGNAGLEPLTDITVNLRIGDYTGEGTVSLEFATRDTVTLEPPWTPDEPGDYDMVFVTSQADDSNPANDTLTVPVTVLPTTFISGTVYDAGTGEEIFSRLDFFLLEVNPDSVFYSTECFPETGSYYQEVVTGTYRVEVTPLVAPYTPRELDSLMVGENGAEETDFALFPAPVMLVAEDSTGYESYYLEALAELGVDTYPWLSYEKGDPEEEIYSVQTVIWSTGDQDDRIFGTRNWTEINLFLESGGSLLLTGQGLQDKWGGFTIFRSRFGVDLGQLGIEGMENRILRSTPDSPITRGDSTAIISPVGQGANNQVAPDEAVPVNGGVPILFYGNSETAAAVAFEHPTEGYRTVFCGFGIEAVPSEPLGYLSRADFLRRILQWFDVLEAPEDMDMAAALPAEFSVSAWPNPFNSTLHFTVQLEKPDIVRVSLYNLLGRTVSSWSTTPLRPGLHQFTWNGDAAAGVYFLSVRANGQNRVRRVVLLK